MKRLIKGIVICGVILCTVQLAITMYGKYLDSKIAHLYTEKEETLSFINGESIKDKGNSWIKESAKNGNLVVMGSSELSSPVSQNIKYNFPNDDYAGNISMIGHANVQNGLHAMDLGANYENLKESNIVIIESIQWFFGSDISADGYMANFSELQFYEFLHNDLISEKNKKYLCRRFFDMEKARTTALTSDKVQELSASKTALNPFGIISKFVNHGLLKVVNREYDFPQTHILAKLYSGDNLVNKLLYHAMRPYFYIRQEIMNLKDKFNTYHYLQDIEKSITKKKLSADWENQLKKAEQDGAAACTNNEVYVYDDYYATYLADGWADLKNASKGSTALDSKEWDDYQFLLNVCEELKLKPYIINVSSNGYYYDYIGIDPAMRQQYYKKNNALADKYRMPIYSELKEKEYEPYVFADVMHLGWKGWIYVTKAITEHWK